MAGDFRIFVQARMSSARLPGKMLAPLAGRPMIAQVMDRLREAGLADRTVLVTSTDPTDDPLADYVASRLRLPVFRGALDDVLARFQAAVRAHPAAWIVRLSGDSPALDGALVRRIAEFADDECDLVSNVVRRTFPPGQSVECIRAATLLRVDGAVLGADDREHVMPYFYRPGVCRVRAVASADPACAAQRLVVDTLDDLRAMAALLMAGAPPRFAHLAQLEPAA